MTDIEAARAALAGNTLALCCDGKVTVSRARGVAPMVDFIAEGRSFEGWSAADKIVGKAAAMLHIYAGISELYCDVLSNEAYSLLKSHGIAVTYGELTDVIINRDGSGMCPMEALVIDTDDIDEGVRRVSELSRRMRRITE